MTKQKMQTFLFNVFPIVLLLFFSLLNVDRISFISVIGLRRHNYWSPSICKASHRITHTILIAHFFFFFRIFFNAHPWTLLKHIPIVFSDFFFIFSGFWFLFLFVYYFFAVLFFFSFFLIFCCCCSWLLPSLPLLPSLDRDFAVRGSMGGHEILMCSVDFVEYSVRKQTHSVESTEFNLSIHLSSYFLFFVFCFFQAEGLLFYWLSNIRYSVSRFLFWTPGENPCLVPIYRQMMPQPIPYLQ